MALLVDAPRVAELEALDFAREILRVEAEALEHVRDRLDTSIARAARAILDCDGNVLVTGMGKAGLVGHKLAGTFCSTGTRAFPLHAADAVHGDLGRVKRGDLVLALSQSGETEEVVRLVPSLRHAGAVLVSITSRSTSTLGRGSNICIELGPIAEADPLGLAPSSSTTAMMAVGDALSLLVAWMRRFTAEQFAIYHPGGSLGRKLGRVEDLMRSGRMVRVAIESEPIRDVFVRLGGARRRSGAVLVVDHEGHLAGIFTDSDLARLFENHREGLIDRPIGEAMTRDPLRVAVGAPVAEAIELMQSRKISELPVVDPQDRPVGLIDITDLIGLLPADPPLED